MKGAMLVGGFGTRLRPLTVTTPKPMLPLVNIPFLEVELLHLKEHGIDEVVLSTGYLPDVFDDYFGDGGKLGMKLTHVTEDEPLGTCGAIKNVEKHLGDGPVIVCNGDILTDLDIGALLEYHREKNAVVTITLTPVEDPTAYGLVPLDDEGRITEFLEKPGWDQVVTNMINAGTYVLDPGVLSGVPSGEMYSFERQLFPDLLSGGEPLYGFPSDCYWLDLGTPEKYLRAHRDILDGRIKVDIEGEEYPQGVFLGRGARLDDSAELHPPCVIGEGSSLGHGAIAGPHTCLGPNVRIEGGARVAGSVVLKDAVVGERSTVEDSIIGKGTVLGRGVVVADGSVLGDNISAGGENEFRKGIRIWPSAIINEGKIRF